ncbi:MAG TPA: hypothetical protein VFU05_17065 [Cyclobacteriaceae bacterium]|nr:hypothetical protein [Cyclobacteriaceae bacterium]
MRILFTLFLIACTVSVFAQTGTKTQPTKIQGTWHGSSSGDQITLILNSDGSGEFDGEPIRYSVKDNKFTLTIVEEDETHVYNYSLQGNSLNVSGGDLEEPMTFTRAGTNTESAPQQSKPKF